MKRYELILFDFDGTLVHTLPDIAFHVNRVFRRFFLPVRGPQAVKKAIGQGVHELLKELAAPLAEDEARLEEAVALFKKFYYEKPVIRTKPYPHVSRILSGPLRPVKKGIVTNKPHDLTHRILKKLGLLGHFENVIGMGFTYPPKPDPSSVIFLMKQLKVPLKKTVLIGDSRVDLETARRAKIDFAWVNYGYDDLRGLRPDRRFSSPSQWKSLAAV